MPVDVVIPALGESVAEAILVEWLKAEGDYVKADEPVAVLETDKADVELPSPASGVLKRLKAQGDTILVGEAIGQIDESGTVEAQAKNIEAKVKAETEAAKTEDGVDAEGLSPAVRRLVGEHKIEVSDIKGTGKGGRVLKEDVLAFLETRMEKPSEKAIEEKKGVLKPIETSPPLTSQVATDGLRRVPMSKIRQRIAQHLVSAQHTAAMLTTFNEADMSGVFDLRNKYKERFQEVHGVSLGLMSFFVRGCVLALREFPDINASIEGSDIVYHDFVHMGIAVGTPRGLVVPVLKHTETMSFDKIEFEIKRVATSARDGKLGLDELSGGTFTITNGGVFGSMLSTPILNAPQTGILGMHAIQNRPVAVNNEVVIRPMMYLALTYDHRLIDGQTSVKFLVRLKQLIEDPARMMLGV